jgi:hypothetical protein
MTSKTSPDSGAPVERISECLANIADFKLLNARKWDKEKNVLVISQHILVLTE